MPEEHAFNAFSGASNCWFLELLDRYNGFLRHNNAGELGITRQNCQLQCYKILLTEAAENAFSVCVHFMESQH